MLITCLSCHREVDAEAVKYGEGFVAVCPVCGKLAYNRDVPPKRESLTDLFIKLLAVERILAEYREVV